MTSTRDPQRAGPSLLVAFRDRLAIAALRETVAAFGDDRSTDAMRAATGATLDLSVAAHRRALLAWLRAWGCRHLRVADTSRSSAALARWWGRWSGSLPSTDAPLTGLGDDELDAVAPAYAALAALRAATRAGPAATSP